MIIKISAEFNYLFLILFLQTLLLTQSTGPSEKADAEFTETDLTDLIAKLRGYNNWKKSQQRCKLDYDLLLPKLPTIAGLGYDIFQGNPLTEDGSDPGIKTNQIFQNTYQDDRFTGEGCYFYAKEVSVTSDLRCDMDSTSTTITSMDAYQKALSVAVKVSGSYKGGVASASFKGSAGYQKTQESIKNQQTISEISQAQCGLYTMSVRNLAPVSDAFVRDALLANSLNDWSIFIADWGTHFIDTVKLGAVAVQKTDIDYNDARTMTSLGIQVSAAAKYSSGGFKVGASASVAKTSDQESFMSNLDIRTKSYYIGKGPVTGKTDDMDAWAASIRNSYVAPITYSLQDIPSLFISRNFPNATAATLTNMKNGMMNTVQAMAASYPDTLLDYFLLNPVNIIQSTTPEIGTTSRSVRQYSDNPPRSNPLTKAAGIKCYVSGGSINGCILQLYNSTGNKDASEVGFIPDAGPNQAITFPTDQDLVQVDTFYLGGTAGIQGIRFKFSEGKTLIIGDVTSPYQFEDKLRLDGRSLVGLRGSVDVNNYLWSLSYIVNTPSYDPSNPITVISYSFTCGGNDGTNFNNTGNIGTTYLSLSKFSITALFQIGLSNDPTFPTYNYATLYNISSVTIYSNTITNTGLVVVGLTINYLGLTPPVSFGSLSGSYVVNNRVPAGYSVWGIYGKLHSNGGNVAKLGLVYTTTQ